MQGDDYLLNEDGLPKPSFPNHWKGKNGLYCSGLSRRGFHGAALDAQNIANDIKALLWKIWELGTFVKLFKVFIMSE